MSTHNVCFHEEIRKTFLCIPFLLRAMGKVARNKMYFSLKKKKKKKLQKFSFLLKNM